MAVLPVDRLEVVWPIIEAVAREGATYPLPRDLSLEEARTLWSERGRTTFVAIREGAVCGTYYLRPNAEGPASHVANAGYMVAPDARGGGIAHTLFRHSIGEAGARGFKALQFNLVVSTNEAAIHLWTSLGMRIVGTLPKVFDHPQRGLVDAYVMHSFIGDLR
ncbi:MAG: GNAT family N-acetyltransferase [Alphaproteobacteria bacterium]|nr:GNAT family N-acetyltransferase [Alphaproteobacteria bacterium]